MCSCTYQNNRAIFNLRHQGILLKFIKMRNLIYKKNCFFFLLIFSPSCIFNNPPYIRHCCCDCIQIHKIFFCSFCNNHCKGCLATSRWTIKYKVCKFIRKYQFVKRAAIRKDVPLTNKFFKIARSHPAGKGF